MTNTYLECENESPITITGSKMTLKVFVYIKAGNTDLLSVNNLVTASQSENGAINVTKVEVLEARKTANGEDEYITDFKWEDLPAVKKTIAEYLEQSAGNTTKPCQQASQSH